MMTIRMARDRLHLVELGVSKKLVYALSGREASELLKNLLMIKKMHPEGTPKSEAVEAQ